MARSDLLVSLVKAGNSGDKPGFRTAAEAIIAEERAKRHDVLADRLSQVMQSNGNANRGLAVAASSEFTQRGKDFLYEIRPRRTLESLILPDTVRQCVQELIEEQHRADLLRAHGLEPRNRVLLVGAPGTGKTTLAEALAEALSVSLFVVRYEGIIGSYLGETAARLKRVFDYARTTPCVLFFDEFDAIGKERGDVHETGEIKRVVSSLLMQVDELPSYTMVVAATNHPELLDRASWRRFQVRVELPLPTRKALTAYLEDFLGGFGEPVGVPGTRIVQALGGVSYAEAEQFCLDVRRRQVLAAGSRSLDSIVSGQMKIWRAKAGAPKRDRAAVGAQPANEEGGDANLPASAATGT